MKRFVGLGSTAALDILRSLAEETCLISMENRKDRYTARIVETRPGQICLALTAAVAPVEGTHVRVEVPQRGVVFVSRLKSGSAAGRWLLGYPFWITLLERRRTCRAAVSLPVRFMCEGTTEWLPGTVTSISRTGVAILSDTLVPADTHFLARFHVQGCPVPLLLRCLSIWSRKTQKGFTCGAEFIAPPLQFEAHIARAFSLPSETEAARVGEEER